MKFFIDENRAQPKRPLTDKAASKIVLVFTWLQHRFARRMNKMIGTMNPKRLTLTLILFALLCGGFSIYLIVNSVTRKPATNLHVEQVAVSKHFNRTGDEKTIGDAYVDVQTFQNITAFKRYMDSLKTFRRGRYDSILVIRPHLMDSVATLEQIYNGQKQNNEYEK